MKVGDKVRQRDPANPENSVESGQVVGLEGEETFHNRPIPKKYVRVNLESVEINTY